MANETPELHFKGLSQPVIVGSYALGKTPVQIYEHVLAKQLAWQPTKVLHNVRRQLVAGYENEFSDLVVLNVEKGMNKRNAKDALVTLYSDIEKKYAFWGPEVMVSVEEGQVQVYPAFTVENGVVTPAGKAVALKRQTQDGIAQEDLRDLLGLDPATKHYVASDYSQPKYLASYFRGRGRPGLLSGGLSSYWDPVGGALFSSAPKSKVLETLDELREEFDGLIRE